MSTPAHGTSTFPPVEDRLAIAVVGAHLEGQPLHHQLMDRDAVLVARTTTSPDYRLYALDTVPPKPGLVRTIDGHGVPIEVEVYEMDAAALGTFVAAVPPPLAIGTITLADGTDVSGFVCEPYALTDAPEITGHGGWRNYLASIGPTMP
jgi:allophanate hydrolase